MTEATLALGLGVVAAAIGFRLNAAYDRWWEGRKLWGRLVNVSRNLAAKIRAFVRPNTEEATAAERGISGFAHALCDHLREGVSLERVPGFESRSERPKHVPSWIACLLYDSIHQWRKEGRIADEEMRTLDLGARELLDVCGACERIRNTPMPPFFAAFGRLSLVVLVLLFPIVLVPLVGSWTVLIITCATFFVVVGETTAAVIENPFGTDPNALDLTRIRQVIETTVGEILTVRAPR